MASGGICDFTDLAAIAIVTVTVTYRAAAETYEGHLAVDVSTLGDVVNANNADQRRSPRTV